RGRTCPVRSTSWKKPPAPERVEPPGGGDQALGFFGFGRRGLSRDGPPVPCTGLPFFLGAPRSPSAPPAPPRLSARAMVISSPSLCAAASANRLATLSAISNLVSRSKILIAPISCRVILPRRHRSGSSHFGSALLRR